MNLYVLMPIPLSVNCNYVIFNEYYLRCTQSGNVFKCNSEAVLVSEYVEDLGEEFVSNGTLSSFNLFKDAESFVIEKLLKK